MNELTTLEVFYITVQAEKMEEGPVHFNYIKVSIYNIDRIGKGF
jgi:hypothetical protein